MTARKIDLSSYPLAHVVLKTGPAMYDVRASLVELCFVPELELTGPRLLFAGKLADTIIAAEENLLLDEAQWSLLNQACTMHKGFGRADVELVRRVTEAPTIEVAEK
jgi:hypothetical protein